MSDNKVIVHKGRTCTLQVNLGFDASGDVFTSEIRSEPTIKSPLIAEWTVTFLNSPGTDGKLKLVLDDSVTVGITANSGYMDVTSVTGGQPVSVFDEPVEVAFRGVVTE